MLRNVDRCRQINVIHPLVLEQINSPRHRREDKSSIQERTKKNNNKADSGSENIAQPGGPEAPDVNVPAAETNGALAHHVEPDVFTASHSSPAVRRGGSGDDDGTVSLAPERARVKYHPPTVHKTSPAVASNGDVSTSTPAGVSSVNDAQSVSRRRLGSLKPLPPLSNLALASPSYLPCTKFNLPSFTSPR